MSYPEGLECLNIYSGLTISRLPRANVPYGFNYPAKSIHYVSNDSAIKSRLCARLSVKRKILPAY